MKTADIANAPELAADLARAEQRIADLLKSSSDALRERDQAVLARDYAKSQAQLYQRLVGLIPAVGASCAADGCTEAVGLVGVQVDLFQRRPDLDLPMTSILTLIGWRWIKGRSYCPRCAAIAGR